MWQEKIPRSLSGRALAPSRLVLAVLLFAPLARAGNIFDDDWTPPKAIKPTELPGLVEPGPDKTVKPDAPPATTPDAPAPPPDPAVPPAPMPPAPADPAPMPADAPAARLPVPSPASQAESRKLFKEVFAKELTDHSPTARRALAATLLEQAGTTKDAPNDQFVLLVGATEAGTEGSDLPICSRAADAMAESYEVDGLHVKSDAALKMKLRTTTPAATAANCEQGLKLVSQLVATNDFTTASRLLQVLRAASPNTALTVQLQARTREVEAMRAGADAVVQSARKLKESPDDPAANLAVGQYLCYMKNDWKRGLPLLAKSSSADASHVSKLELAGTDDPQKQADLGDLWWNISDKSNGPVQASIRQHAASWYDQAFPKLGVLRRASLQKRMDQASPSQRFDFQNDGDLKSWNVPMSNWVVVADGLKCTQGESVLAFKPTSPVGSVTISFTGAGCSTFWFLIGEARYRIHWQQQWFGVLPPDFDRSEQPEKWKSVPFKLDDNANYTAKFWMAPDDRPAMSLVGVQLIADKFRANSDGLVRVVSQGGLVIHSITISRQ